MAGLVKKAKEKGQKVVRVIKFFTSVIGQIVGWIILIIILLMIVGVLINTIFKGIGKLAGIEAQTYSATEDNIVLSQLTTSGYNAMMPADMLQDYLEFEYAVLMDAGRYLEGKGVEITSYEREYNIEKLVDEEVNEGSLEEWREYAKYTLNGSGKEMKAEVETFTPEEEDDEEKKNYNDEIRFVSSLNGITGTEALSPYIVVTRKDRVYRYLVEGELVGNDAKDWDIVIPLLHCFSLNLQNLDIYDKDLFMYPLLYMERDKEYKRDVLFSQEHDKKRLNIVYKIPLKTIIDRYMPKATLLSSWYALKEDDAGRSDEIDKLLQKIKDVYNAACLDGNEYGAAETVGKEPEVLNVKVAIKLLNGGEYTLGVLKDYDGELTEGFYSYIDDIQADRNNDIELISKHMKDDILTEDDFANIKNKITSAQDIDEIIYGESNKKHIRVLAGKVLNVDYDEEKDDEADQYLRYTKVQVYDVTGKFVEHEYMMRQRKLEKYQAVSNNSSFVEFERYEIERTKFGKWISRGSTEESTIWLAEKLATVIKVWFEDVTIRSKRHEVMDEYGNSTGRYSDWEVVDSESEVEEGPFEGLPGTKDIFEKSLEARPYGSDPQYWLEQDYDPGDNGLGITYQLIDPEGPIPVAEIKAYLNERYPLKHKIGTTMINNYEKIEYKRIYHIADEGGEGGEVEGAGKFVAYKVEERIVGIKQDIAFTRMPMYLIKSIETWSKKTKFENKLVQNPFVMTDWRYIMSSNKYAKGLSSLSIVEDSQYRTKMFKEVFRKVREKDVIAMLSEWETAGNEGATAAYTYIRELYKLIKYIQQEGDGTIGEKAYTYLYIPEEILDFNETSADIIYWMELFGTTTDKQDKYTSKEYQNMRSKKNMVTWQKTDYNLYEECISGGVAKVYALFPFGNPLIRAAYTKATQSSDKSTIAPGGGFSPPSHNGIDIFARALYIEGSGFDSPVIAKLKEAFKEAKEYYVKRLTAVYDGNESKATNVLTSLISDPATNAPIVAVAPGIVVDVRYSVDSGFRVKIQHEVKDDGTPYGYDDGGTTTYYMHMRRWPLVQIGDYVGAGTVIGYEGNTGASGAHHIHFEVRKNENEPQESIQYIYPMFNPFYYKEKAEEASEEMGADAISSEYYSLERTILMDSYENQVPETPLLDDVNKLITVDKEEEYELPEISLEARIDGIERSREDEVHVLTDYYSDKFIKWVRNNENHIVSTVKGE